MATVVTVTAGEVPLFATTAPAWITGPSDSSPTASPVGPTIVTVHVTVSPAWNVLLEGHFTVQFAAAVAKAQDSVCVTLGGVMVGNAVVDINQTNYAWFEAGYTHSLISQPTWDGLLAHCDFTIDMGVDESY